MALQPEEQLGKDLPTGSRHYRAWVGPPQRYDLMSATQFNLLTMLGLREDHSLLDIGCGSLRGGRLFMTYLLPEHYYGIEPEEWLIQEGIAREIGRDLIEIKRPTFSNDGNFTLSTFGRQFDFILAQSIFSHASQAQIQRCLSEARVVMKPTSMFVANFGKGETNYTGDSWVYPDGVNYTLERMQELGAEHGLVGKTIFWPHPNGLTWIVYVLPEHAAQIADITDQLPFLKSELEQSKKRIHDLEAHPYVKAGMTLKKLIRRFRS